MNQMLYERADKTIRHTLWSVLIDDSATLHVPGYYKKYPDRARIYTPLNNKSRARITIHEMILHHADGTSIAIPDYNDLILITDVLKDYLEMCDDYVDIESTEQNEVTLYIKKAKNLHHVLTESRKAADLKQEKETGIGNYEDSLEGLFKLIKGAP